MLKSANDDKLSSVSSNPANDSQHVIDIIYLVITDDDNNLWDYSDLICNMVYSMPSNRNDFECDHYDQPSPKEGTRNPQEATKNIEQELRSRTR